MESDILCKYKFAVKKWMSRAGGCTAVSAWCASLCERWNCVHKDCTCMQLVGTVALESGEVATGCTA